MEETQGQAPTDSGQAPQIPPTSVEAAPEAEETFDAGYVKKLRSESADYRKKLRESEARLAELEKAALTEQERREKRLAELEAQQADWMRERQEMLTRTAVAAGAAKLGLDPELAWRLLDPAELEFEDDKPKNVEVVLKGMVKKWPQLAPAAGASPTNPARVSSEQQIADAEEERRRRVYGGKRKSPFDMDEIRQHGGGVVFPEPKQQ